MTHTDPIKALVDLGPELQKRYDSRSVMNPTGSILLTYEEAPIILAAIEALTPIADGGSVVVPVEEMTMKTPVGWVGEVALSMGKNGKYTDWSEPRFSFWKPNEPEGAIRNLYPVYARLAPAAAIFRHGE